MNLLCHLRGHQRALPVTHNHGLIFTTCARCGEDMVRARGAAWGGVPPGFRVVWKPRGHHDGTAGGHAVGLIKSSFLAASSGDAAG